MSLRPLSAAFLSIIAVACDALAMPPTPPPGPPPPSSPSPPALAGPVAERLVLGDAPQEERDVIERLRHSPSWVRRAFAAERLARFDCEGSEVYLRELLRDDAWRVRCFALLAAARRSLPIPESAFANEPEVRVIRTALRARYRVPEKPLKALVARLTKSEDLEEKLMGLELTLAGALPQRSGAGGDEDAIDTAEVLGQIIMRMDRVEAGSLSPRLAEITAGHDSGRNYKWRDWYRKNRKDPGLRGAFVVPAAPAPRERGPIALLPLPRLIELERHMRDLSTKPIEIAIALDCTSSMSGEIAECQSGIDALMLFAQDVAKTARIGIVGYRDQQDDWETRGWDLTASLAEARDHLWQLSADGGGDRPESVLAGLRLAYTKMSWQPDASRSVVVVGDAPPRPGTGEQSVEYAKKAFANGVRTYTIAPRADVIERTNDEDRDGDDPAASPPNPDGRTGPAPWNRPTKRKSEKPVSPWRQKLKPGEVEYWKEIAVAGGGRTVGLPRDASLIAEIAGLTLGDAHQAEFESFFDSWFSLCR